MAKENSLSILHTNLCPETVSNLQWNFELWVGQTNDSLILIFVASLLSMQH
jgi:hypothetical protein